MLLTHYNKHIHNTIAHAVHLCKEIDQNWWLILMVNSEIKLKTYHKHYKYFNNEIADYWYYVIAL